MSSSFTQRIGLVVPSSNVTMEIEIPAMLRRAADGGRFSFHSSRMAMRQVSAQELREMDAQSLRCAAELADARVEVLAYACLVAVMVQGAGAHVRIEQRLRKVMSDCGSTAPVISSAGALVKTLQLLNAKRIALIAPYMPALTNAVISYLQSEGITTADSRCLSVPDNYEVGCIPAHRIEAALGELQIHAVDALVLSACVQMPSLSILETVQNRLDIPVITASACTSAAILHALGRDPTCVPGGAGLAWAGGHDRSDGPGVAACARNASSGS
jgi:maleate isomerase